MYWSNLNVYKSNVLLEAYSEKFIKERIAYLKKTGGGNVDDVVLRQMVNRFDALKMTKRADLESYVKQAITEKHPFFSPQPGRDRASQEENLKKIFNNPLQLEFYTFKNLEGVIDRFPPEAKKELKKELKQRGGGPPIPIVYKNAGVMVFFASNMKGCQMFQAWARQQNIPKIKEMYDKGLVSPRGTTPSSAPLDRYALDWYNYCIGYPGGSLYNSYRFGRGGSDASMYYVYNNDKPITDPFHCFVVQARRDGKTYLVTNAFNTGDVVRYWDNPVSKDTEKGRYGNAEDERGILQIEPKLAGAKDIMVFHEFSEDEQLEITLRDANAANFDNLTSMRAKQVYIETPAPSTSGPRKIYRRSFDKLPPELQHMYVNQRAPGPGINPTQSLINIINLFQDSDITQYHTLTKRARAALAAGDPDWQKQLVAEPSIDQTKKTTQKYYSNLIISILDEMGKIKRAGKA